MLSENKFHTTLKKNDKCSMIAFKPEMIIQEDRLRLGSWKWFLLEVAFVYVRCPTFPNPLVSVTNQATFAKYNLKSKKEVRFWFSDWRLKKYNTIWYSLMHKVSLNHHILDPKNDMTIIDDVDDFNINSNAKDVDDDGDDGDDNVD